MSTASSNDIRGAIWRLNSNVHNATYHMYHIGASLFYLLNPSRKQEVFQIVGVATIAEFFHKFGLTENQGDACREVFTFFHDTGLTGSHNALLSCGWNLKCDQLLVKILRVRNSSEAVETDHTANIAQLINSFLNDSNAGSERSILNELQVYYQTHALSHINPRPFQVKLKSRLKRLAKDLKQVDNRDHLTELQIEHVDGILLPAIDRVVNSLGS